MTDDLEPMTQEEIRDLLKPIEESTIDLLKQMIFGDSVLQRCIPCTPVEDDDE